MNITDQLTQAGLTHHEAQVYLAALQLGPASITEIAKKAQIKRPTVYNIIPKLLERELLIQFPHKKRVLFQAQPPRKLLTIVSQQQQAITNVLPLIEEMQPNPHAKPKVTLYEGKSGILQAYKTMAKTSQTLRTIISLDEFYSLFDRDTIKEIYDILRKNGGSLYDLLAPSQYTERYRHASYTERISRTKVLPSSFSFPIDIVASPDKVTMISFRSMTATIIEDSAIATAQYEFLKYLWKTIK